MIFFRKINETDGPIVSEWIRNDPDHHDRIGPGFFLYGAKGASVYAAEDGQGPIVYVRQEVEGEAVRIHTQFPPSGRRRIDLAMREGFPKIMKDARGRGFKEIVFESGSPALMKFMAIHFGFRAELKAVL